MTDNLKYEAELVCVQSRSEDAYGVEEAKKHLGQRGIVEFITCFHHITFSGDEHQGKNDEKKWRMQVGPVTNITEVRGNHLLTVRAKGTTFKFRIISKEPDIDTEDYFKSFCVDKNYDPLAINILEREERHHYSGEKKMEYISFVELFNAMKERVFGQDEYLETLCMAVENLQMERRMWEKGLVETYPLNTILVAGESGTGKTHAIKVLAEITDMEAVVIDMTQITGTGWRGNNLSEVLAGRLRNVDKKNGLILFFDEFDKCIGSKMENENHRTFDVIPEFLKLIEDKEIMIESHDGKMISHRLDNAIFIFAGAFSGIEEYIEKRLKIKRKGRRIGFSANKEEERPVEPVDRLYSHITHADFAAYNLNWQFLGRMTRLCVLNRLTEEDYMEIIRKSDDSTFLRHKLILWMDSKVDLDITDEACNLVVKKCKTLGIGARGLNVILTKAIDKGRREVLCNGGIWKILIDVEDGELATKTFLSPDVAKERMAG